MQNLSRREKEKLAREADIIVAAKSIFQQKGFNKASMDEIAKAAQFTKRTVYQYFINKEDLYFAVTLKEFKQLISNFDAAMEQGSNGLEKFQLAGHAYYRFYKDSQENFRLLNYCQFITTNREISPNYQQMIRLGDSMYQSLFRAVEQGKTDGSIRTDVDTQKLAYSVVFLLVGFFYQLSEIGGTFMFKKDVYFDQDDFILFNLGLLSDTISATKCSRF